MKNKKFILFLMSFFMFIFILASIGLGFVNITRAEDMKMKLEVGIPGFSGEQLVDGSLLGKFGSVLYIYLIGLSGIVAVIILILAGFEWVTAGGNQNKIGQAKERIKNALTGLVLLACSHLILYTINPELVKIKVLDVGPITSEVIVDFSRKPPETMEELVGRDAEECWNKGGAYQYRINETSCRCDNSGVKETFPMSYDQNSWCCICNNCPSGSSSRINNCWDDCVAKGCTSGNPWSATLRTCCTCGGCPAEPEQVYNLGNGCEKWVKPYLHSCIATQADMDDQFGYTPNVGEPGYCLSSGFCALCIDAEQEAKSNRQCTNYPPNWDKNGSDPRYYPCGEEKIDDTVSRKKNGECKDTDY